MITEALVRESTEGPKRFVPTLRDALDALLGCQESDGHWCGELQGDSILESEYLLMKFILGQEQAPMADGRPASEVLPRIASYLRSLQRSDGGWGQYPGSDIDVSATVKAYFVLKLMGDDPSAEHMAKAREVVLRMGGAENCASFTNFFLAALGQISWNAVPEIPPEIVFLPRWFYFSLANVSAWTRTMIMPLSVVSTLRPTRKLPQEMGIDELFLDQQRRHSLTTDPKSSPGWAAFFGMLDRALKGLRLIGGTPVRRLALKRAERWVLDRAGQDGPGRTDGLGAIFPPMVYIQITLSALGYSREHPALRRAERELDNLFLEEDDTIRIQPCFSPVWDTGMVAHALADCGLTVRDQPARRCADWLLDHECIHKGDWAMNTRFPVPAGGWWFEYNNAWYPDVDDTAMVAMALQRCGGADNLAAARRGVRWLLALQNNDGGWAAFDRTKDRRILENIPFADHNAMQDPSCPDITGRVLECLGHHGYTTRDDVVAKAIEYMKNTQDPDGCWFGRWGVNYIYGTWQSAVGICQVGVPASEPWMQRAGQWLKSVQQSDGAFGESANSYEDPTQKGQGPATASQTSWGAMALQAIYGADDPDVERALQWLADTQLSVEDIGDPSLNPDNDPAGSWVETWFTGTGFPRVFYLRYHLYRMYFPVMALGRYLSAHGLAPDEQPLVRLKPKVELAEA